MKKKLFALALLTTATVSFAAPVSSPNNLNDSPVIGGSNGTCGTVDLTNATSDYLLKPCETAVIKFNNQLSVPLHIAVPEPSSPNQPVEYEVKIYVNWASGGNMDFVFLPNNKAYPGNQFTYTLINRTQNNQNGTTADGVNNWNPIYSDWNTQQNYYLSGFYIDTYNNYCNPDCNTTGDRAPWFGDIKIIYNGYQKPRSFFGTFYSDRSIASYSYQWNNTQEPWSSLGSFMFVAAPKYISGFAVVKRIY
ncbi:MAG: hypothetical protein JHC31_05430 [Sulfurihydrogenibium sp.]|jgi:hypothetical protein|nr:hypothetical protein [Sulfurihydrogenibium sp.]